MTEARPLENDSRSASVEARDSCGIDAYRLAFEHAAVGIFCLDLRLKLICANPRLSDLTGYSETELLQLPSLAFVHPDDRKAARRGFWELARERGARFSRELRCARKDGGVKPIAISATLAKSPDARASRIVAIVEDIQARKAAEDALRASEERFRLAMLGANEGLFDWNIAEDTTYLSPRWKSMLGYADGEVDASPSAWEPLLAPGALERLNEQLALLESGAKDTYEFEFKLRHKDGRWIDVLSRAFPVFDANHKMVRLVGTHQDITERKRHEAELNRAAKVFECTHEGIVVTDPQGRIESINPAFELITGYNAADVLGKRMNVLQSGRQDRAFYDAMWTTLAAEGHWQGEIWNRRKDGSLYPQWLTISGVKDKDGAIVNYIGLFTDISQIKQSQARLDFLAYHDPLTALPNRLLLTERITRAIGAARRDGRSRALLFLDLDRFKTINDSLGHAAGDELLTLATDRWKRRLTSSDALARLGGDEFVVLLDPISSPLAATRLANDLIDDTMQPFLLEEGREAYVGLSVGIAIFPCDDETNPDALIQRANSALYAAKEAGGGIRFYSPAQTVAARGRLEMETGLRRALERGELALQYQPQVRLADHHVVGVESLIRWRSPRGLIPPGAFIPLTEKTGLIIPIGEWVLRESCRRMKDWLERGYDLKRMAVNLSPRQFDLVDIRDRIRAILDETGLAPERLEIEITEGALMEQGRNAARKLESLKALGLRIAVDDFGTGHSSLAYLRQFPIDALKLDRSFISDIPADSKAMEIAAAVIRLGHSLHVDVLVEGVETEAQADFLALAGCPTAQGYLFAKPMWEPEWLDALAGREGERGFARQFG